MKVKQFDDVKLKDGKTAAIVEAFDDTHLLADIGDSPDDWDTIEVTKDEILEVL